MPDNFVEIAEAAESKSGQVDASGLAEALGKQIRGEVRFDRGTRALYATDGSNYRQVPIGVVLPRDSDDVVAAVALCREFGAPLLCRGGGTSLAGQCCNVAVILDFSKYMASILEIDPARRIARVQPGVILDHLPRCCRKAPSHLRSRSRHARPLHSWRHDRQQLLRRSFRNGRQDRRQYRSPRNPHLRRHTYESRPGSNRTM